MSYSYIPAGVKYRLWGRAAGRCQYDGCNQVLSFDSITKGDMNKAYIAHIIGDSPDGPRGHAVLSEQLKSDISNLMLMCDEHHRLIDREDVDGHPVDRLCEMKRKHEQRIEILTSIADDRQSHVVLYGANIGQHGAPVSIEKAMNAMNAEKYPAEKLPIELSLKNSAFRDHEDTFWAMEREHLRRQFADKVKARLDAGQVEHLSVYALAPQPLLIELGRLLSDKCAADVYQLHREPSDWKWQEHPDGFDYIVTPPENRLTNIALNLSLSGTIENGRIIKVLGDNTSIWTMTVDVPNNDYLKSQEQLRQFRERFRRMMNEIKATHGHDNLLHVFPAVPVSVAVEIGRSWMPKADLPLRLYDENRDVGGFIHAFDIP